MNPVTMKYAKSKHPQRGSTLFELMCKYEATDNVITKSVLAEIINKRLARIEGIRL